MSEQAATMTPEKARERIHAYCRLFVGRARIEHAERTLGVKLYDIARDDDLVVIFAETMMERPQP